MQREKDDNNKEYHITNFGVHVLGLERAYSLVGSGLQWTYHLCVGTLVGGDRKMHVIGGAQEETAR